MPICNSIYLEFFRGHRVTRPTTAIHPPIELYLHNQNFVLKLRCGPALCPILDERTVSKTKLLQNHPSRIVVDLPKMLFAQPFILALATLATAHPGHEEEEHRRAIAARAQTGATKRSLENCAASLESRGIFANGIQRRAAAMAKERIARRIPVQSTP
jgi:hypothetical protein